MTRMACVLMFIICAKCFCLCSVCVSMHVCACVSKDTFPVSVMRYLKRTWSKEDFVLTHSLKAKCIMTGKHGERWTLCSGTQLFVSFPVRNPVWRLALFTLRDGSFPVKLTHVETSSWRCPEVCFCEQNLLKRSCIWLWMNTPERILCLQRQKSPVEIAVFEDQRLMANYLIFDWVLALWNSHSWPPQPPTSIVELELTSCDNRLKKNNNFSNLLA